MQYIKPTVMGIDPGGTIGIAVYKNGSPKHFSTATRIEDVLKSIGFFKPDIVVVEDYILAGRPGEARQGKHALMQIGVIDYYCRNHSIPMELQSPGFLSFGLKKIEHRPQSPHVASAAAHAVAWIARKGTKS